MEKRLLEEGAGVFSRKRTCDQQNQSEQEAALYEQIGRLKMELEWLKKKLPGSIEAKRMMLEPNHPELMDNRIRLHINQPERTYP